MNECIQVTSLDIAERTCILIGTYHRPQLSNAKFHPPPLFHPKKKRGKNFYTENYLFITKKIVTSSTPLRLYQ